MDYYDYYHGFYFHEPSFFGPAFEDHGPLLNDGAQQKTNEKFPRSVFFITGNEFCERFSYYGIRACLAIYLANQLHMEQSTAISIYHTYIMVCYFMPVFGSMLADGYLGKFRTIFYLSLIYALGNIVLSLSATPPTQFPAMPLSMVGLFLIALGTGGIKPCVSAFGGDQFEHDQDNQREKFFFIFYFSINAGSLISTFLTPFLKDNVSCLGMDTCYPLAFGIPAILMIIAVIIFVCGKAMYTNLPPTDNMIANVSKCIGHAIKRRWKAEAEVKDHWLDYADDEFDDKFRSDVKAAIRVMHLFLPLPLFWALFDQQGSLWTFQAQELDGRLLNFYEISPEQMQLINPLLILMLIPLFKMGIYPLLAKFNLLTKPLKRMFVGGLFAALAFVVAGVLQLEIESKYPTNAPVGSADISFINNGPCELNLKIINGTPFPFNVTLDSTNDFYSENKIYIEENQTLSIQVTPIDESQCFGAKNFEIDATVDNSLTLAFIVRNHVLDMYKAAKLCEKPEHGNSAIRLVYNLANPGPHLIFKKQGSITNCTFNINQTAGAGITKDNIYGTTKSDYCYTTPGVYYLHLPNGTDGTLIETGKTIHPASGGQYDCSIYTTGLTDNEIFLSNYAEVAENDMSMLFQIPQYVLITAGEIMFSISGLEFSYSQAPASMKAVLQAAWLLTVAFGNLFVIIISEAKIFYKYSYHYFLYASLLVAVMLIFAFVCLGYVYVTIDGDGNVIFPEGSGTRKRNAIEVQDGGSTAPCSDDSENDDITRVY